MNIFAKYKAKGTSLFQNQKGVAAIEFALIFPILILIFLGSTVLVEGFRTKRLFEGAAFNLVDLATRINRFDESDAQEFYLIGKAIVGKASQDPGFTLSLAAAENVFATPGNPGLTLTWSCASDELTYIQQEDIDAMDLPNLARGQGLVIAQVRGTYVPAFNLDTIGTVELEEVAVRRPRQENTLRLSQTNNSCKLADDL